MKYLSFLNNLNVLKRGKKDTFEMLKKSYSDKFPLIFGTSVKTDNFPKDFGELILKFLGKIRIYTMSNNLIAELPLIMNENPTIRDAAIKVHRRFYDSFDHAIVIREGERQKRKKVGLEYILKDKDIIEIHIT